MGPNQLLNQLCCKHNINQLCCKHNTHTYRYDLEATTNKARTLNPVEIIELSCVIVQTATASITASFQTYVRPTEHPQLDPFCVELCGIQQSQVDAAPLLADAMQLHHEWLQQQGVLAEGVSSVPVTWTEWDLKVITHEWRMAVGICHLL